MSEPAGWRQDPWGRHEWRYFVDGRPTHHVSDAGVAGTDYPPPGPVPQQPPPIGIDPGRERYRAGRFDDPVWSEAVASPTPHEQRPERRQGLRDRLAERQRRAFEAQGARQAALRSRIGGQQGRIVPSPPTAPIGDSSTQAPPSTTRQWKWRNPPGWPPPPQGWHPPSFGWYPPPGWPPPPPGWQFWEEVAPLRLETPTRRSLVWETRFVMLAFLFPAVASAVVIIVQHALGVGGSPDPLASLVSGHPLASFFLGIPVYLEVGVTAPLALLLLWRTGQHPSDLGLGVPGWFSDIWPAIGLLGATFGVSLLLAIPFAPLEKAHRALFNPAQIGHVPHYYVIYGLAVSATTAIAEETVVNGYLMTRLEQLGWNPQRALLLSLVLRTSYHIYYGIGFIFVIPFGYFMTRSFQKNRRLTRAITAHFIWDAALMTIAILTS